MPRGYRAARYLMDNGTEVALMVDADSIGDPNRGWEEIAPNALPFAPRGFLPRIMVGVDETGRTRTTRVGRLDCNLWTFTVREWSLEGSDGVRHVVSSLSRMAERQIGPRLTPLSYQTRLL